jgi:hypothetical protein
MDLRRMRHWAIALGLIGAAGSVASAAPITFTGNVEADMPSATKGIYTTPGNALGSVAQADWMNQAGWITGWAIKDIRFSYDKASDTLQVGINTYSIAGNSSGNGTPGIVDPRQAAVNGVDPAHIGGLGSISMAFAADGATTKDHAAPIIIAGVPADKSHAGPGTDGFTVSSYVPSNSGIAYSYGANLPGHQGALAFDPSAQHPNFEFSITNLSKIPGLDPTKGFWVQAFAGSPNDVIAGEDTVGWVRVPTLAAQQVPEPTTIAAWTLLAGGAAIGIRRSRRREVQN